MVIVYSSVCLVWRKPFWFRPFQRFCPIEIEALVGSVVELGRITGVPTPSIDAIYAATRLLAHTLAAQHGRLRIATD